MDLQRFTALCEAYGGDMARWPEAERADAASLAAREPAAAGLLVAGRALDQILDESRPVPASAALRERILAAAPAPRRERPLAWIMKAGLGAGLAAAGVAGLLVGGAITAAAGPSGPDAEAVAALETSPEATAFGAAPETLEG